MLREAFGKGTPLEDIGRWLSEAVEDDKAEGVPTEHLEQQEEQELCFGTAPESSEPLRCLADSPVFS